MSRRYRFVSTHSHPDLPSGRRHPVARLCAAVGVTRSGYYAWLKGEPVRAAKAAADAALTARIGRVHADSRCAYGAKRIALDLAEGTDGAPAEQVNHKKVARLMRDAGIAGTHLRRRRGLTRPDLSAPPIPDLVGRDFTATAPDAKWCGDITFIPVGATGFIYLATVIDLFSGRLIGWSIADHHRAELARDALAAAVATRGDHVTGVVFHTDRGAEYTSDLVADYCHDHGIRRSMGRTGSCYDNAPAESFFATYKRELVSTLAGGRFTHQNEARRETFRWIAFYNHRRRHSRAARLPPVTYEEQHHTRQATDNSDTVQNLAA